MPALRSSLIPLWLKLAYTAFMCALFVAYMGHYGSLVFLWLCDVALTTCLLGLWLESAHLLSMAALGITVIGAAFSVDFAARAALGAPLFGLSAFMFDSTRPRLLRALSLYHLWAPVLLMWLVRRLGYRSAAWQSQSVLAVLMIAAAYVLVEHPWAPAGNVNWVFGPGEGRPDYPYRAPWALFLMVLFFPLMVYGPTHLLFRRWTRSRRGAGDSGGA